jgi:cell division protein FtsW (lipid II flippase)
VATRHSHGRRAMAESAAGIVMVVSAAYIVFNETFANWQSVWFCAGLLGLAAILLSVRDAPSSR